MAEAHESEAVQAFIRERQAAVLAEAIRQLSTCSRAQLPEVAHAVAGSLGSYQLHAAYERVTDLRSVVDDTTSSGADVDSAWTTTLEALRALEAGTPP